MKRTMPLARDVRMARAALASLAAILAVTLLISGCVALSQSSPATAPAPGAGTAVATESAAVAAAPALLPEAGASAQPSAIPSREASQPGARSPQATAQAAPGAATTAAAPRAAASPAASTPGAVAAQPAGAGAAEYVSPLPGSSDNPAGTTIAVRYGNRLDPANPGVSFEVTGSASGRHDGSVALSDDGQTLIFKPNQPFAAGESVQVRTAAAIGGGAAHPPIDFTFSVLDEASAPTSTTGQFIPPESQPLTTTARYATLPADFPIITVTVPASGTAAGLIFASNFQLFNGPSGYYLLILDNQGEPVFAQKLPSNTRVLDFRPQPDGTLSYADDARNAYVILDHSYREVGTVTPGNGYAWTDQHDLRLLPNGHYLLMANEVRTMDLSKVVSGGPPNAEVTGQVIQELDRSRNVVFQWRVLDYIPITETSQSLITTTVDFSHSNSIDLDTDGNLLLSSRHLDEITKIDRQTGDIIWRMGGKGNQFAISAAPGIQGPAEFYHQHDARRLPNGHITVFDNHNDQQPQVSRALEYAVDEKAKTATLVWEWQTQPPPYAIAMGNVQRLANGNTVIGWGTNQSPDIEEIRPDGTVAFALNFGGSDASYRALREEWHAVPDWPPALVAQNDGNDLKLTFSWNGATDVAAYRINGGNSSPPTNVVAEQPRAGFETSVVVPDAPNAYCFYQVVPIDAKGEAMRPSAVVPNPAAQNPSCKGQ